ncbi:MAG: family 1 glycosylhydrolase [Clostridiales bacterium]|nr:family 1 glycosylhydrolase [Clostridiales bacterium]
MSKFLLGAATAAHQVEGNNSYSDSWAQEQMKHTSYAEPSLDACDHYNRYAGDIRALAEAGLNAYRFSIEWARIEPQEGQFDPAEIEHYRQVIRTCREYGVEPIVTLHHFSSPKWLITKGGWDAETVVEDFSNYVRYVMEQLGGELSYVCTINEANMRLQIGAFAHAMMEKMKAQAAAAQATVGVQLGIDMEKMLAARAETARETRAVFGVDDPKTFFSPCTEQGDALVMKAHQAAVAVIRALAPQVKVGLTLSLHDIQAVEGGEENAAKEWDEEFRHYLPAIAGDDFLGVQNYTRSLVGPSGTLDNPEGARLTQSGYEFYPQALGNVIRAVARDFHGELLVTENGVATADDAERIAFIEEATNGVAACIAEGIPVKGYLHWSLLDNFEWQKGYGMTFGLIAVDRKTQVRTIKPSLAYLGSRKEIFHG